ncbi:hypothetical protein DASC09_015200 [Saccharomycopsis crataegensis]|uniref:Anaphase-promoting complex subunit 13 n=1 Tax=Saccharomycopsis crataegensis TaxID=43959 RepID=A0AAV5QGY9_9ASCO|nr:hypothetical protein DASC09_015200 [Saccharomycopsis crataegensis]
MSRGSDFSFIHMKNPHHIIYMQEWSRDILPYDDIELSERYLHELSNDTPDSHLYRENNGASLQSGAFGSSINNKTHQKRLKEYSWKDLDLKRFLTENHSSKMKKDSDNDEGFHNLHENLKQGEGGSKSSWRFNRGEPIDNSFGGIHIVSHDHTILETVQKKYTNDDFSSMNSMNRILEHTTDFSLNSSPNTTNTTTTSLSRNTNRLTVSDQGPPVVPQNNIFNTP